MPVSGSTLSVLRFQVTSFMNEIVILVFTFTKIRSIKIKITRIVLKEHGILLLEMSATPADPFESI